MGYHLWLSKYVESIGTIGNQEVNYNGDDGIRSLSTWVGPQFVAGYENLICILLLIDEPEYSVKNIFI